MSLNLEEFNQLPEHEQMLREDELVYNAFQNSFLLLTSKITEEDLIEEAGGILVAHDICARSKMLMKRDAEAIMTYFADLDEFDKAIEIRDLIKIKYGNRKQKKTKTKGNS
tara:strand:+ start:4374 stop:4706 length:333 start_codon:yes stop_codon:yes gene_type:complete